ncbi:MAG TPA: NAD(P)-dependent oxidoreductase [Gaiellaceae bacterium]|nr:NAD(P)-dependent oxidoreductase [Gaiellaceae bacterium]
MIVATGPVAPVAEELLGEIVVADERTLATLLPRAEVLIVRGGSTVSAATIEAAPNLRVIARTGVGFDQVDVAAATRRGIPVVITPGAGAPAVAEAALALVVALAKRLPELDRLVREGRWAERDAYEVRDLEGMALGILGFGRIGRRLAVLAERLGMRVLAYDPYAEGAETDLPSLFAESDAVSLHAPLTEETRGIVDAELLAGAKPGLLLVNLARGAVVSSLDDLLAALERGSLGGVGLDVFDPEPPDPAHPIFRHPRVLVSPHSLWRTPRALERTYRELSEGVLAVLRGDRPAAVANPELYTSK